MDSTDIHLIYWKTDLFQCPSVSNKQSAPLPLTISINAKDSLSPSSVSSSLSVKIGYPRSDPRNTGKCEDGCSPAPKST